MLPSRTLWSISEEDTSAAESLCHACGIHPIVARLLVIRGIRTPDQANRFLQSDETQLHDPFLMDGMGAAVERIQKAIEDKQKIYIYGDYDADGVSSTALMVWLFRHLGARFDYYIPHRQNEGYGLNKPAIELAKQSGAALLVTVDNGISAREEVAFAQELGMDVIVTDHHEPPEKLPEALAVINPKKPGCPYPFKQLAGVGVAYKLAQALMETVPDNLVELAAIGTIGDLMPLVDENRILVKLGLERMQNSGLRGLRALLDVSRTLDDRVTETDIGFAVAPRINACGRMAHAEPAVRLLTTESDEEAVQVANEMNELNKQRQKTVEAMTREAFQRVQQDGRVQDRVIVIAQEGWNVGVVGIVASKIIEKTHRPTVILAIDPDKGEAKGSARSIEPFDMYKALSECESLLEHYGGHQAAGGMTLKSENIGAFRERINRLADEWLTEDDFLPKTSADLECELEDITLETIMELQKLAPFGNGNPSPRFKIANLKPVQLKTVGKQQQHLKLQLQGNHAAASVEAIAFGQGVLNGWITPQSRVQVLGSLGINEWNGFRKPQVFVEDLAVTETQLFDWRGAVDPEEKLKAWSEVRLALGMESSMGLLLGSTESCSHLCESIENIEASNYEQAACQLSPNIRKQITDVFLLSLPKQLNDLEEAVRQLPNVQRIYALFHHSETFSSVIPNRERFKQIYARLMRDGRWNTDDPKMLEGLSRKLGISVHTIRFILDVFEELELIERKGDVYTFIPSPDKKELTASHQYRSREARLELENRLLHSTGEQLSSWLLKQIGRSAGSGTLIQASV